MAEDTVHEREQTDPLRQITSATHLLLIATNCHATDDGTRNEGIEDDALLELITTAEDRLEAALMSDSDMPHECSEALAEALSILYLARAAAVEPTALGRLATWRSKWMGVEAMVKYALQAAHRLTGIAEERLLPQAQEVAHG